MLRDLRPLFSYMRRYRWGYVWGSLSVIATNAVSVQGPRIIGKAIDYLKQNGATRQTILFYAGLLVAVYLVKGIFLYAQRWILIGISRKSSLGKIMGDPNAKTGTTAASVGAAVLAYERGASIFRVHDVREHIDALTAARAIVAR